ncbi:FeoA family protein [Candidatus Albibeggiatoa sp. nov. BB20]|uniref:FeoA family protein n=1 Tax=Candidatus Albibeggiatoa sp. nov. BB20 TaxID=3162723 RepID=UPI0033657BF7
METCLGDMQLGDNGKVTGIRRGEKPYRQKLLAMGLTPGTTFSVTRYAPMGDPVEIKVRGFALSLRQAEANALLVEKIES